MKFPLLAIHFNVISYVYWRVYDTRHITVHLVIQCHSRSKATILLMDMKHSIIMRFNYFLREFVPTAYIL